jgi:type II secretory pathway pseudopilin PulG
MLVVVSIISLLMAILVPAVNLARRQARAIVGMSNQRDVTTALNLFAADNRDQYPDSVARVGFDDDWSWTDPAKMTGFRDRHPQTHRSMSACLASYIPDAKSMFCPSAPQQYKYLQEVWEAGDDWDNPDTPMSYDPFTGTYCFYWDYVGYLSESETVFRGPTGPASSRRQSQLLISDYFGYGQWRSPDSFGSCEQFGGAGVVPETQLQSAFWAVEGNLDGILPEVKLRAAFTDGHVETYSSSETTPMKISQEPDGIPPYEDGTSSGGIFFIPKSAVQ